MELPLILKKKEMFNFKEVNMKYFRVFATIICSICFLISLHDPVLSAEDQRETTQRPLEIQKQPTLMKPDLSCYFSKEPNGRSIWIFIQNNTPWKADNFVVHVESVKDGIKVYDRDFSGVILFGNDKKPFDLIPCDKRGQKFSGVVDFGGSIVETNENNNTCEYTCGSIRKPIPRKFKKKSQ
jgi:hypothetical protein